MLLRLAARTAVRAATLVHRNLAVFRHAAATASPSERATATDAIRDHNTIEVLHDERSQPHRQHMMYCGAGAHLG
jgi:hypothetical protein